MGSEGDPSNSTRVSPSTSGAGSSNSSGAGGTGSVEASSNTLDATVLERRRAASHDAVTGARRKTMAPSQDERLRKRAQSMTAVNGGGSGREAGSGGTTRSDHRRGSGAPQPNGRGNETRRPKDFRQRRETAQDEIQQQREPPLPQGPFSISLRDMMGGMQNMRHMGGSFSRGLLSSSSPPAGVEGTTTSMRIGDRTINHGRRFGQAKRLAQPGRLAGMSAGDGNRR